MTLAGLALAVLTSCQGAGTAASAVTLVDLAGGPVQPLQDSTARATVFLFVRTDCPISNRFAPEVRRLHESFAPRGIAFWVVYPDPDESPDAIRAHVAAYGYSCGVLRDPAHALVSVTGATVTPEAALFVPGRDMVYRGRIDDRFIDFGVARSVPANRDLEMALTAVLAGRPVSVRETPAIGCFIRDLR